MGCLYLFKGTNKDIMATQLILTLNRFPELSNSQFPIKLTLLMTLQKSNFTYRWFAKIYYQKLATGYCQKNLFLFPNMYTEFHSTGLCSIILINQVVLCILTNSLSAIQCGNMYLKKHFQHKRELLPPQES